MIVIAVHQVVTQLLIHADGVIPDPAPMAPVGSGAVVTFLGWLKWGSLACCVAAALLAGGMIPLGNTSRRAELAERGKVTLICVMIGAIIVAVASSLVSAAYGLG
jgi:hypothetical protein